MTKHPDLRDMVGDQGPPEEREQLQRVHDLLIAAGPPPALSPERIHPPQARTGVHVHFLPDRRRQALLLLAAAVLVLGIGIGYTVRGGSSFTTIRTVSMHGLSTGKNIGATIRLGKQDRYGNWPLLLNVHGLKKLPTGGWYTLYLTKAGKPIASCGTFNADDEHLTVRLNAPYDLNKYSGWVVAVHHTEHTQPEQTVLTT